MEKIMITQNESTYTPRFTSVDLAGSITEKIKELAEATDRAKLSEEMIRYLDTYSRFHQYSIYNVFCILMSFPEASQVAGFQRWRSMGRYVRKGEKGIPILAPILISEDPDDPDSDKILRGFKIVYVYDISQTDGQPLPKVPNWKSAEKNRQLEEKLIRFANKRSIMVSIVEQRGEIQGISKGKLIEVDPNAGTKTLIHEIAQEVMHRDVNRPNDSSLRELEAEAVAYVVSKHFGLNINSSPNYLTLHGIDSEKIMGHLERIRKTAVEIINEIEESNLKIV